MGGDAFPEPEGRAIGLGQPVSFGATAVEKRLDVLRRHWNLEGERLLDVGCGNGAYTIELARGFSLTYGIDVEAGRIDVFRRRLGDLCDQLSITVHQMSAEQLDFDDEFFDVVTAIEVIEHVLDLERALSEVNRVLKEGGAFLVTCPNELFPFEAHNLRIGRRRVPGRYVPFVPWVRPLHRRIGIARNFSARSLRLLLESHGFRTRAIDYVMPPFDHWQAGRRFVKPLLDRIEKTPLRVFGVSLVGVFVKESARGARAL